MASDSKTIFILPELLTGTLATLMSNGVTTGAVCVILLSLIMGLTSGRRRRLNVQMSMDSLPRMDEFLRGFAVRSGWNEPSVDRLRSAGEETLASLLSQESQEENERNRLIINARRDDGLIELEFMVTSEGENLEDKLAYLSEQPEIHDEEDISFRLLRHYASSVQHRKYHDIDIVTVQVAVSCVAATCRDFACVERDGGAYILDSIHPTFNTRFPETEC